MSSSKKYTPSDRGSGSVVSTRGGRRSGGVSTVASSAAASALTRQDSLGAPAVSVITLASPNGGSRTIGGGVSGSGVPPIPVHRVSVSAVPGSAVSTAGLAPSHRASASDGVRVPISPAPRRASPSVSPRPSRSRSPQTEVSLAPALLRGGSLLSAGRSAHMGQMGQLDWKPYDSVRSGMGGGQSSGGGHHVETILSPELEARREEVARRKEAAAAQERAKFATAHDALAAAQHAHANANELHAPNSTSFMPIPSSPSAPSVAFAPPSPAGHSLVHPIGGLARKLPNAHTTPSYDAGKDIFGADYTREAGDDSNTTLGGKRRNTMAAGRVHLDGREREREREKERSKQEAAAGGGGGRSTLREVKMRTSAIRCWPICSTEEDDEGTTSTRTLKPPPPGVAFIYSLLEHSRFYLWLSIAATIFSLFARDFLLAFLPKILDESVDALLLCCLSIFSLEIIASAYAKENYFFVSFLFWLDLVGTFSLCFDITIINDAWFPVAANASGSGQVATILRLTKFARVLRILKIVRIVRIFKLQKTLTKTAAFGAATPSKVGLTLSEFLDKKVVMMMMAVLVLYPVFTIAARDDLSRQMGMTMIASAVRANDTALLNEILATYLDSMTSNDMFYFASITPATATTPMVVNQVYLDDDNTHLMKTLRTTEYEEYTQPALSGTGYTLARFNQRSEVFLDSVYTFSFTICVILIFTLGALLMSRDVQALVVDPLDRTMALVKRLTGTILFLNQPTRKQDSHGMDLTARTAGDMPGGLETDAIEDVIAQMAHIFSVVPDPHPQDSHLPKSLAMLSGSKHTQIKTLNSVVQIDVSERPRQLGEDEDLDGTSPDGLGFFGTSSDAAHRRANTDTEMAEKEGGGAHEPRISDFPELQSIEHILHHSALLPYFRLFMTSNLSLENLLFVQEVDRFRTIMKLHVVNLYNAFVSPRAPNQVNLPSLQRDRILSELDHAAVDTFDEAQHECIALMATTLQQFQNSKFCLGYMRRNKRGQLPQASPLLSANPPVRPTRPRGYTPKSKPFSYHQHHPSGPPALYLHPSSGPSSELDGPSLTVPLSASDTLRPFPSGHRKAASSAGIIHLTSGGAVHTHPHTRNSSQSSSPEHGPEPMVRGTRPHQLVIPNSGSSLPGSPMVRQSEPMHLPGSIEGAGESPDPANASGSRRSTAVGHVAPAVAMGGGQHVAEQDLNDQIAQLIQAEGSPNRSRQHAGFQFTAVPLVLPAGQSKRSSLEKNPPPPAAAAARLSPSAVSGPATPSIITVTAASPLSA